MAGGKFYVRIDENRLVEYERQGYDAASDAARQACALGVEVARREAPRGATGNLRGTLKVGSTKAKRGSKPAATIEAGVPYAVFQEFGTGRGVEAKAFIRKGLSAAQRAWPDLVARQL